MSEVCNSYRGSPHETGNPVAAQTVGDSCVSLVSIFSGLLASLAVLLAGVEAVEVTFLPAAVRVEAATEIPGSWARCCAIWASHRFSSHLYLPETWESLIYLE